jgi:NADP-dependent 3-hydroxy acid dehydrogenase YdfG
MATATPTGRQPELAGQTVVLIGGSAGVGVETARRARAEGAAVILTGRNLDRLRRAAAEVGAVSSAAFDAADPAALGRFFSGLPETIDHVMVTAGGPYHAPLADLDRDRAHRDFGEQQPNQLVLAPEPAVAQRSASGSSGAAQQATSIS